MLRSGKVPSYRLHKRSGRAVVTIRRSDGVRQDIYLGEYNSLESRREYGRIIAEQATTAISAPQFNLVGEANLTVDEVILAYFRFAEQHYRRTDGTATSEIQEIKYTLAPLRKLYGQTRAAEFGPLGLATVREQIVASGCCRSVVNRRVDRVKRMYRWATSQQLVPVNVYHALRTLSGLQRGRTQVREAEPVKPVEAAIVDATLRFLGRHIHAMVQLQRVTGMRPGELCAMRISEVDRTATPWVYRPAHHKTLHRGKERVVMIGPRGRRVIEEFLAGGAPVNDASPLFSPWRFRIERSVEHRTNRKTKVQPSQANRRKKRPKLQPAVEYTSHTYAHAVRVAAKKASAKHWHPNQLRHLYASEVRKAHGLEAAQVLLGHASANITQVYAERDMALAATVAMKIG